MWWKTSSTACSGRWGWSTSSTSRRVGQTISLPSVPTPGTCWRSLSWRTHRRRCRGAAHNALPRHFRWALREPSFGCRQPHGLRVSARRVSRRRLLRPNSAPSLLWRGRGRCSKASASFSSRIPSWRFRWRAFWHASWACIWLKSAPPTCTGRTWPKSWRFCRPGPCCPKDSMWKTNWTAAPLRSRTSWCADWVWPIPWKRRG